GGWGASPYGPVTLTSAEIFDPSTGRFTPTGPLPAGHNFNTSMVLLNDGRVFVYASGGVSTYTPTPGTFSPVCWSTMVYPETTLLADGRVLIVGVNQTWSDNTAQIYDPATGTLRDTGSGLPHSIFTGQTGSMATYDAAMTLLPNGKVLLMGG